MEDSAEEVSESLVLTMEDIEKERAIAEKSGESVPTLGSRQNIPQYSPQYLETLAALRRIADFMPEKDCFLMHGAVIAWKNQGYLFTAPSGTGKSTHLALWKKYLGDQAEVINGDKPFLKVTEDEVWGYGTPWAGKEQWQVNKKVALKGICFLGRGEKNSIQNRFVFSASISYASGLFYRCSAERRKDDGAVRPDAEKSSVIQNEVRYFKGSIRVQLWCDDILIHF